MLIHSPPQNVLVKLVDLAPKDPHKVPQETLMQQDLNLPSYMVNVQRNAHDLVLKSMDPVRLCLMDPTWLSWY